MLVCFFFSSRRRHTRFSRDWSSDVCSSDLAGALDVPEIDVTLVSVWDGVNNTNSVGIGEPSTVPTAAAIANAVSHALGVRVRQIPITPEVVLAAVRERDQAKGAAGERRAGSPGRSDFGPV